MSIITPAMAFNFRILANDVDQDSAMDIMQQGVNYKIDFVAKTISVDIRTSVMTKTLISTMNMSNSKEAPSIEVLDSIGEAIFRLHFKGNKLLQHDLDFGYDMNEVLIHKFKWSFKHCYVTDQTGGLNQETAQSIS